MKIDEAKRLLSSACEDEPVGLPPSVLSRIAVEDVPEGTAIQVGVFRKGVLHVEWNGRLYRQGDAIYGEADHTWTRKYWYSPLGLEQYLDLVRRAVETRRRIKGDVEVTHYDDDGAYVILNFRISTSEKNFGRAYDAIRKVAAEVEEAADAFVDEIGQRIAEVAARLSGWGSESIDSLVDAVENARTSDDKGRALEELCSRLFSSVLGFTVTGRVRTETEEIDISVLNGSSEPRLSREGAIILVECKNWTGRCGKNEFVVFHGKVANRGRRCSLGFLVSWNGFAETVTKEMLRGSREEILIVPMTGADIRSAVREQDFTKFLLACWDKAVHT